MKYKEQMCIDINTLKFTIACNKKKLASRGCMDLLASALLRKALLVFINLNQHALSLVLVF